MRTNVFTLMALWISIGFASAETRHVPTQYATIQEAIDASLDGDTVLVDPGVYVQSINFLGKAIHVISAEGPDVTEIRRDSNISVVTFDSGES